LQVAADIMQNGPDTHAETSAQCFLRNFHGITENPGPIADAFIKSLDLAPLRPDYLPLLGLENLEKIDREACLEYAKQWASIRDTLLAGESLIVRNRRAFDTFLFTIKFLVHIHERAATVKSPDSSERSAILSNLLAEGNAIHDRILEIWDTERFPDDPKKAEAALDFGRKEYLILTFRESLDRCSALLGGAVSNVSPNNRKSPMDRNDLMKRREPDPVSSSAFTLIELLVVIGIILLLVALTMPAITSARQKAAQAKSLSNVHQISVAINLFATENNDYFPLGYFYQPPGQGVPYQGELSYVTELLPYVGGLSAASIFIAPTSAIQPVKAPAAGSMAMTYSVHNLLCPDTSNGAKQVRRTVVARPSEVILIADGSQSPTSTYSRTTFTNPTMTLGMQTDLSTLIPVGPDADTTAGAGWFRYRSSGAVTVAMVDGHAQTMQKGTITYGNIIPDR
jgi:type II secretory pathway pseudopilin PulG